MITILKNMLGKTAPQRKSFERTTVSSTDEKLNSISKLLVKTNSHLQCPHCSESHLQLVFLKAYQRIEGRNLGSKALLSDGKVEVTRKYREQQRNLRVGTEVVLECEGCGKHSVFSISHEKGLNWLNLSPCELL